MITEAQFDLLLPLACTWAQEMEAVALRDGAPLSSSELADAAAVGVTQPAKVRLAKVPSIPVPENPALRAAAMATHLISPGTAGLALRYGIFIRADCWGKRRLVLHELVHTSQYERLGGFEPFLRRYLHECITIGYPEAPMEQEAIHTTLRLCS